MASGTRVSVVLNRRNQLLYDTLSIIFQVNSERIAIYHYENLSMQYIQIFSVVKNENCVGKISIFFLFLLKT